MNVDVGVGLSYELLQSFWSICYVFLTSCLFVITSLRYSDLEDQSSMFFWNTVSTHKAAWYQNSEDTQYSRIFKNLKYRVVYGRLDVHKPLCLVLRHFITTNCDVTVRPLWLVWTEWGETMWLVSRVPIDPAVVQVTVSTLKLCLSLTDVIDCGLYGMRWDETVS
jgi:hypothetical protein